MRIDLYTAIHKAQRFHMCQLANDIGSADMESDQAATALVDRVRDLVEHLRDHARNEETYIHPLFDAAGTGAHALRDEHDELEADLEEIERVVREDRRQDLYPAYTRFLGKYLLHLSEEEDAQRQVLWPQYDDDTLRGVLDRFKAERPLDKAAADFEFMLPALSAPELASLLRSMRQAVSPDVFGRACEQGRRLVAADLWQRVASQLAAE
jgi:hemerythrin